MRNRKILAGGLGGLIAAAALTASLTLAGAETPEPTTKTPIKHVVVIFQENASFDHYFGTYPEALNPAGEPQFVPAPSTPSVNGLGGPNSTLRTDNPNLENPERLDRSQAITCDNNHDYDAEQEAYNAGLVDQFVQKTQGVSSVNEPCPKPDVMDYYDGNTVTALWNYAQHYALNDNSFGTTYGPSTTGALNLIAGQTHGASPEISEIVENGTDIGDAEPYYDGCKNIKKPSFKMEGPNIGTLMNSKGITWGWFEGGFAPTSRTGEGQPVCGSTHTNIAGVSIEDYSPHHEPFQYYASTANPLHLPPSSASSIGTTEQANHQYDISDFKAAIEAGAMPAVSFLKAPKYEDGHPGYSDPLDEQRWLVDEINEIQKSKYWSSTAIVIAWDDSDGWYDHVMPPLVRSSESPSDRLNGPGKCGTKVEEEKKKLEEEAEFQDDRCGFGPRLPLLVISPYAKQNYVDNTLTDQSSIIKFVEENWSLGSLGGGSTDLESGSLENMFEFGGGKRAPALDLNPVTGEPEEDAVDGRLPMTNVKPSSSSSPGVTPAAAPSGGPASQGSSGEAAGSNAGGGSGSTGSASSNVSTSSPAKPSSIELRCKVSHRASELLVGCSAPGFRGEGNALRMRLVRDGKVYANEATSIRHGRAQFLLEPRRALPHGTYTIRLAFETPKLARGGEVVSTLERVKLG